jgi:hypothetical protein
MASPAEIVRNWDSKIAAPDNDAPASGWIVVNGEPQAVWLPPGETAASLGLKTFRKEMVLASQGRSSGGNLRNV